jgi:hypothetical protein
MASSAASEPCSRASIVHGYRSAVVDLWGPEAIARVAPLLTAEAREATIDSIVLPVAWLPTEYLIDWQRVVWESLAKKDDQAFRRFVDRGIDHGFGRFRRMFLKVATVDVLIQKTQELWRHQHTHGELTATRRKDGENATTVVLHSHPFVEHPISRRTLAEAWRYVPTLTRVKDVRETHALEDGALVCHLTWA